MHVQLQQVYSYRPLWVGVADSVPPSPASLLVETLSASYGDQLYCSSHMIIGVVVKWKDKLQYSTWELEEEHVKLNSTAENCPQWLLFEWSWHLDIYAVLVLVFSEVSEGHAASIFKVIQDKRYSRKVRTFCKNYYYYYYYYYYYNYYCYFYYFSYYCYCCYCYYYYCYYYYCYCYSYSYCYYYCY